MYQNERDDSILPFNMKHAAIGVGATAGLSGLGLFGKSIEKNLYNNVGWFKKFYDSRGMVPNSIMRGMTGRNVNYAGGFFHHLGKVPEDMAGYLPKFRKANEWDRVLPEVLYGRDIENFGVNKIAKALGKDARVFAPSFNALMGIGTVKWELESKNNVTGLATGAAKEVLGQIGGRLGTGIGSSLGHFLTGGFGLGGWAGAGIGMLAGSAIGYAAIDNLSKMAKLGRQWSLPELGGNYEDSQASMTMRARSLNAIRTSQFNVRNSLGNEAYRLATGM